MGLKVASTPLHWSQPSVPPPPSSSQTLASAVSSPSSKRCSFVCGNGALFCRYSERSQFFDCRHQSSKLHRSRSCDTFRFRVRTIRRATSASLNSFSDEEFSKNIQELALRSHSSNDDVGTHGGMSEADKKMSDSFTEVSCGHINYSDVGFLENLKLFDAVEVPEFLERDQNIPANIERKANSVDIPMSLRMIKRRKQWQEGFVEAGQTAYCSMKKAFSSMVFIIRELHSYTLHMRQHLLYEDLRGILARVQTEIHESFVWLFQQVFSHTPTLMVYVMILLANYSVYSVANNTALASTTQAKAYTPMAETVSVVEDTGRVDQKFDSSAIRTLKLSSLNGKTTSIGGNNGGGKERPVASGTDGDGRFDESNYHLNIIPDGMSSIKNPTMPSGEEPVSREVSDVEEMRLWNSIVDEASRMHRISGNEALDHETMQRFVSPIDARIEGEDHAEFFRTELQYQTGLTQDPSNPLLLANYAQFLYIVGQEFDRAEEYFKKATKVEPKDAEALNKYANFLWLVRKDLWAAEEMYLEAISAEPGNSYYAANYAHFLWNTGGEDTCFPLDSPDLSTDE
ncbi:hypothetical protein F511_04805 [Dorcoceras hygrometricum]|uniref:Uncharacterized protein n=1 Tax=Dorcoceras hygrometricum TaxID=472368 RepID=A0A2Z7AV54_9LAMI|nr:hypothetical protein F511_04805 [Dorcoceras hygrometricum]